MSTTQPTPPKQKASVDDIVQELRWLNQGLADFMRRHEEYVATMHARAAYTKKHHNAERIIQAVLCGFICLLALSSASAASASGTLPELTAQNAAATKAILPGIIAILSAMGVWRAIKTQPPAQY